MLRLKALHTQYLYHHSTFVFVINSNIFIFDVLLNTSLSENLLAGWTPLANNKLIKTMLCWHRAALVAACLCLLYCCHCCHYCIALWDWAKNFVMQKWSFLLIVNHMAITICSFFLSFFYHIVQPTKQYKSVAFQIQSYCCYWFWLMSLALLKDKKWLNTQDTQETISTHTKQITLTAAICHLIDKSVGRKRDWGREALENLSHYLTQCIHLFSFRGRGEGGVQMNNWHVLCT